MINDMGRPLIVVFGSYYVLEHRDCYNELSKIILEGNRDNRMAHIKKDIVGNLDFDKPAPPVDSDEFGDWVKEKSDYYILNSDFNAIFILQGCEDTTPWFEAQYALDNGLALKTIILLEEKENDGENSAVSLYAKSTFKGKFKNPPIDYFDYKDYKTAWHKIMIKFFSLGIE